MSYLSISSSWTMDHRGRPEIVFYYGGVPAPSSLSTNKDLVDFIWSELYRIIPIARRKSARPHLEPATWDDTAKGLTKELQKPSNQRNLLRRCCFLNIIDMDQDGSTVTLLPKGHVGPGIELPKGGGAAMSALGLPPTLFGSKEHPRSGIVQGGRLASVLMSYWTVTFPDEDSDDDSPPS